MKTGIICKYCNEDISINANNIIQYAICDYVLRIKCHIHWKQKHNKQYLTTKGLAKCIIAFIIVVPVLVIWFPLWLITYPFWWVHERIH